MSEKNKEIVGKVNATFLEGNFEGFLEFCADDVEWTIVGDRSVKGKDAIRQWMKSMAAENPEPPKFTVVDPVIAEGDFVTARGDMTMKDKNGKAVPYSYCDVYRFRGDKIVELSSFVIKTEAKYETSSAA
ncbi:MAG: nuclear transport factor 2 family protein [Pyrinomonadaceae bacterium]